MWGPLWVLYIKKGVVTDSQVINFIEYRSHVLIVIDHCISVLTHPASCLPPTLLLDIGSEVHVREVAPDKKRFIFFNLLLHEICGSGCNVVINGFHTLSRQWIVILDFSICKGVQHTTRTLHFAEFGIPGIVAMFWLFLSIEVIQVAIKLIKTMICRQHFITITEMIFTRLPGGVTKRL